MIKILNEKIVLIVELDEVTGDTVTVLDTDRTSILTPSINALNEAILYGNILEPGTFNIEIDVYNNKYHVYPSQE